MLALHELFRSFAQRVATAVGHAWAFALALAVILVWAITGPAYHFSDTWQLVINTGTTIVTFLMVFLIQNTQARETKAMRLKLDELLRAAKGARNSLVELDELTDEELEKLQQEFERLRLRSGVPGGRQDQTREGAAPPERRAPPHRDRSHRP